MTRRAEVTITYLRQTERPRLAQQKRPAAKLAILRAENPPAHFFRYLYDLVGRRWNWGSRRALDDAALEALIREPDTFLYVLHCDGVPAGMAEICAASGKEADIRFFGLAPEFIGRGLSRYFLANVIDLAWAQNPSSVRIETCTMDHPAALPLYQKFGFVVFDQKSGTIDLIED